jgi:hypothetical protein
VGFPQYCWKAGISDSAFPVHPSLILGFRGRDTMPFWLAATTFAVTLRFFHRTFPRPSPSVSNYLPSDPVIITTGGDFSPCVIAKPCGRLASIDVMGILFG